MKTKGFNLNFALTLNFLDSFTSTHWISSVSSMIKKNDVSKHGSQITTMIQVAWLLSNAYQDVNSAVQVNSIVW